MRLLAIAVATTATISVTTTGTPAAAWALPPDPAPAPRPAEQLPDPGQVSHILTGLTDPGMSNQQRDTLVQGGIDSGERRAFTSKKLAKATRRGELPLSFTVGNVWSVGPRTVAAQVTLVSPKLAPTPEVFTFVYQDRWMLSSDSAATLIKTIAED